MKRLTIVLFILMAAVGVKAQSWSQINKDWEFYVIKINRVIIDYNMNGCFEDNEINKCDGYFTGKYFYKAGKMNLHFYLAEGHEYDQDYLRSDIQYRVKDDYLEVYFYSNRALLMRLYINTKTNFATMVVDHLDLLK